MIIYFSSFLLYITNNCITTGIKKNIKKDSLPQIIEFAKMTIIKNVIMKFFENR